MKISPTGQLPISPAVAGIPKADLHLHAEAGPRLQRLLANDRGEQPIDWTAWITETMRGIPPGMPRLSKLTYGQIPEEVEAEPQNFLARVLDVLKEAAENGAIYAEVRFGRETVLRPDFVKLFRQAEKTVNAEHPAFVAEPLATLLVGPDSEQTDRLVEGCLAAAKQGLAGVDFIPQPYDSEADWTAAHNWAHRLSGAGLGITIHAGEFTTANIEAALKTPGIKRLGHAVFVASRPDLLERVAEAGVAIECSLTSNVILGAVENYKTHPITNFIEAGIPVTLNTDNPTRFNTNIAREYEIAHQLGLDENQLRTITRTAIEHSFTTPNRRQQLLAAFS